MALESWRIVIVHCELICESLHEEFRGSHVGVLGTKILGLKLQASLSLSFFYIMSLYDISFITILTQQMVKEVKIIGKLQNCDGKQQTTVYHIR